MSKKIWCLACHVFEVYDAGDLCVSCYKHCLDERYRIYELEPEDENETDIQRFS